MTNSPIVRVLIAFGVYLIGMVFIGAVYMRRNSNSEDYFLGGRNLGGFVAALSAQASDMSGWLLMGLPADVNASLTFPVPQNFLTLSTFPAIISS